MSGSDLAGWFRETYQRLREEIGKVVVGQDEVVETALIALFAGGHVLLEGVPGLGKTLLVRTMAEALDLKFGRLQFTPDLMPADVTGTNILVESETGQRAFAFRHGPVFANILLADEINRATPKTQSALLEAMQEHAVTISGTRHVLDEPFWVMATQNPIEMEGTYPLPEAQLDRFMLKILVPYPKINELREIVNRTTASEAPKANKVADGATLIKAQNTVREVPIATNVMDFALKLIMATHPHSETAPNETNKYVMYGASPRGIQALVLSAKVCGLMDNRYNVSHEDIVKAAKPVLRHRLLLNYEAEADGITPDNLIDILIKHVGKHETEPVKV